MGEALEELRGCRMPCAVGHLDPNPRNIVVSSERCCFLDWAECAITHPFFTFEYIQEHARRSFPGSDGAHEKLAAAYSRPWRAFFSEETLGQAIRLSRLLAVFACAAGGNAWASRAAVSNPVFASYFRSLVRRAYREAVHTA